MLEKQVKAIAALSAMAVLFLSVIGRILGERLLGVVIAFCRSCWYAL
jgi:putative effector of murein hydrolase